MNLELMGWSPVQWDIAAQWAHDHGKLPAVNREADAMGALIDLQTRWEESHTSAPRQCVPDEALEWLVSTMMLACRGMPSWGLATREREFEDRIAGDMKRLMGR